MDKRDERKSKMAVRMTLALVLAAVCGWSADGADVCLSRGGVPQAKIVIAADAGRVERYAADELKLHLDEITGGRFEIVTDDRPAVGFEIRVGESRRSVRKSSDFASQEWLVDISDSGIELIGHDGKYPGPGMPGLYDRQGTLYAVYEFLEVECGVRWLNPTDCGTYLPKRPDLSLRIGQRKGRPAFRMRGGDGIENRKPVLWKKGSEGEARYLASAFGKEKAPVRVREQRFFLRHRAGGEKSKGNHSFYGWYERFWKKTNGNFEAYHPEYFSKGPGDKPPQLCYSNPAVIAQAVKDARDYFDHGGYRVDYCGTHKGYEWGENTFALSPMDGGGFCQCPACAKQYEPARAKDAAEFSTYWFTFVNAVAREVKKTHPDKMIMTSAYAAFEGLPTNVRLEDNVIVDFAFSANRTPASPLLQKQMDRMRQWRNAYPRAKIQMWLYNCFPKLIADNAGFHCFPGYCVHEAQKQFDFFREIDAMSGIFYDGFDGDVEGYVHLKLLLDPARRVDDILDEFFAPLGAAGKHLRAFYSIIEERYSDPANWPTGSTHENVGIAWGRLGTKDVMERLARELDLAEKAAANDFERENVRLVRLGVWDYMKEGFDAYVLRSAAPMPTWTAKRVPSAGGAPDKVDWTGVEAIRPTYHTRGTDVVNPFRCEMRLAHDGEYLYVELVEHVEAAKLQNVQRVMPADTWEFLFANDRSLPYRYYITAPDGRFVCFSYGEVNWRMMVPAAESGDVTFRARAANDWQGEKDRWTARYSFPLDWVASKPVKPGESLCANIVRVMSTPLCGVPQNAALRCSSYSFVPYTAVHTTDRTAMIVLER